MDEKSEFSLAYKTDRKKFEDLLLVHIKGNTHVYRLNSEKVYEVVLQNKRAVKGDHKITGKTKIFYLSKHHIYENDIIQWEPRETLTPEYWKVKRVESLKQWINCTVEYFRIEDADIIALLRKHGYNDSAEYFSKSKRLIQENKPVDFSDCKNNCRKALASFFKNTTGTDDSRQAMEIFLDKQLIGKREVELFKAFEELVGTLSGFLAKKGSHPPMPQKEEARLAVEVTEAFLRYLLTKHIQSQ